MEIHVNTERLNEGKSEQFNEPSESHPVQARIAARFNRPYVRVAGVVLYFLYVFPSPYLLWAAYPIILGWVAVTIRRAAVGSADSLDDLRVLPSYGTAVLESLFRYFRRCRYLALTPVALYFFFFGSQIRFRVIFVALLLAMLLMCWTYVRIVELACLTYVTSRIRGIMQFAYFGVWVSLVAFLYLCTDRFSSAPYGSPDPTGQLISVGLFGAFTFHIETRIRRTADVLVWKLQEAV